MKNICKFLSAPSHELMEIRCFIYETDPEIMRMTVTLEQNRMFLFVQGKGIMRFNEYEVPIVPGNLVFGFRGEEFAVRDEEPCVYMYIEFEGTRPESLLHRFGIHSRRRSFSGFEGMIPLWQESLTRASELSIDIAAESMLLYAFSRMTGIPAQQYDLIDKMTQLCEERFNDPGLSLASAASELGYNAKYMSHLFKERMGIGFTEYLRTRRLQYAMLLFDQGLDSVKNVSLLSGFADPCTFPPYSAKASVCRRRNTLTGARNGRADRFAASCRIKGPSSQDEGPFRFGYERKQRLISASYTAPVRGRHRPSRKC